MRQLSDPLPPKLHEITGSFKRRVTSTTLFELCSTQKVLASQWLMPRLPAQASRNVSPNFRRLAESPFPRKLELQVMWILRSLREESMRRLRRCVKYCQTG